MDSSWYRTYYIAILQLSQFPSQEKEEQIEHCRLLCLKENLVGEHYLPRFYVQNKNTKRLLVLKRNKCMKPLSFSSDLAC